jgi:hypothetical protein
MFPLKEPGLRFRIQVVTLPQNELWNFNGAYKLC